MDTETAIHMRLAMILDDNPEAHVLVAGRYMPPVRCAYMEIKRAAERTRLRQTVSNGGHIRSVTDDGGSLDAYAPHGMACGRRADAFLFVGEIDDMAKSLLKGYSYAGIPVFTEIGV